MIRSTGAASSISFRLKLVACAVCGLAVVGCGNQGEIRQYTIPPEREDVITSEVLKDEFGAIPFEWEAPQDWTLAQNDQFSKVAWEVGDSVESGRITVSDVSMGMGLVSQLTRWRGQIGMEQKEGEDPMADTEQLKLGDTTATYVNFAGEEQSIIGMMFPYGGKLWVFKFRGSNAVAEEQRKTFRQFCESVKISG